MGYDLGVDLGGTTVVAAVLRDGRTRADAVALGPDGSPSMPATAHRGRDGAVRTGADAERRATLEPDRVVRDVTARLGDDVPLIVGDEPWRADDVAAEIVLATVRRVASLEGGAARSLAVTHPAGWGPHRERTLRRALVRVGLGHATLVATSRAAVLAAATFGGLRAGRIAAVYDLGGRRFHAAVVRRGPRGVVAAGTEGGAAGPGITTTEVLADSGAPVRAGGIDIDAAVLAHVRDELGAPFDDALAALDDDASRHALAALQRSARVAKERLSTDTEAPVSVTIGDLDTTVRITRADLEARITPLVTATVDAFADTVDAGGAAPDLIVLVGGSTRIPLVARLLAEELGRPVHPELDPVTVVAEGAALAAAGHAATRRQDDLARGVPQPADRHTAVGAAVAAGFAVGASAARIRPETPSWPTPVPAPRPSPSPRPRPKPSPTPRPSSTSRPAEDQGGLGSVESATATETATAARQPARSGTTALLDRPRTGVDDVPRPPVATLTAPLGGHPRQGPLRRYRAWIVAVLAIIVLVVLAAVVPIPGLTATRTATTTSTTQDAPPRSMPAIPVSLSTAGTAA